MKPTTSRLLDQYSGIGGRSHNRGPPLQAPTLHDTYNEHMSLPQFGWEWAISSGTLNACGNRSDPPPIDINPLPESTNCAHQHSTQVATTIGHESIASFHQPNEKNLDLASRTARPREGEIFPSIRGSNVAQHTNQLGETQIQA